jgi:hypothetical protein
VPCAVRARAAGNAAARSHFPISKAQPGARRCWRWPRQAGCLLAVPCAVNCTPTPCVRVTCEEARQLASRMRCRRETRRAAREQHRARRGARRSSNSCLARHRTCSASLFSTCHLRRHLMSGPPSSSRPRGSSRGTTPSARAAADDTAATPGSPNTPAARGAPRGGRSLSQPPTTSVLRRSLHGTEAPATPAHHARMGAATPGSAFGDMSIMASARRTAQRRKSRVWTAGGWGGGREESPMELLRRLARGECVDLGIAGSGTRDGSLAHARSPAGG